MGGRPPRKGKCSYSSRLLNGDGSGGVSGHAGEKMFIVGGWGEGGGRQRS